MAVTPRGVILDMVELFGAESLAQRYCCLARLRGTHPNLKLVIHDDACHLRKYADNRKDDSDVSRVLAHPEIRYVVDRFHARGHVDEWCIANCSPKAPGLGELVAGKTQACAR